MDGIVNPFVVFEVKLDKDRGIIIVTIRKEESDNVCFFRFHHQTIDCHPEQVQQIIRSHKITARTKSIKINIYGFVSHYWNINEKYFEFKGVKPNSTNQQIEKLQRAKINKEIGVLKRQETGTNQGKQMEKMKKLEAKLREDERQFQIIRANRIAQAKADIDAKKSVNDTEMLPKL